jgi:hypothetical protein
MTMLFSTREIVQSDEVLKEMHAVGMRVFGDDFPSKLIGNNWSLCSTKTKFYGAYHGDSLVSFVGFLAHSATMNNAELTMFQACHVATERQFQGKGLFSKIVAHAISRLDGDFIIGFPNSVAEPIWVKRFNFNLVPLRRIWINLAVPDIFIDRTKYALASREKWLVRSDERAVAAWKTLEHPGEIITIETFRNFVWGRVVVRKFGLIKMKVFLVGGLSIDNPRGIAGLLKDVRRKTGVSAAQMICTETSPLCAAARFTLHGKRTEPLIWLPIKQKEFNARFDLHIGIKDVA